MNKKLVFFLFVIISFYPVYAQRVPVVAVLPFEAAGLAVSAADAQRLSGRVISEMSSWGTLEITGDTSRAGYIIRGTLSRQGGFFVLAAETLNAHTGLALNDYREQASAVDGISIPLFCAHAAERIPLPNYLLGTWQSTINLPDGPVVCIIEFRSNRTVSIERYDTWEHRQGNALRYEGFGGGSYTYTGFVNRMINVSSRQVRIDASVSVNLALEETLPEQTNVSRASLGILFNNEKTSFEIVNSTLPCGRNYDGPSVYPSEALGFTQFTKIR